MTAERPAAAPPAGGLPLTRELLERWKPSRAWRLAVHRSAAPAIVDRCRCSGEHVARRESGDLDAVAGMRSGGDGPGGA